MTSNWTFATLQCAATANDITNVNITPQCIAFTNLITAPYVIDWCKEGIPSLCVGYILLNNHRDHEKWEKVPHIPPWGEIKLDSVMHKILGTCMAHLDAEVHCIDWAHSSVPEIIQSVKHTISFMIIQTNKKKTPPKSVQCYGMCIFHLSYIIIYRNVCPPLLSSIKNLQDIFKTWSSL